MREPMPLLTATAFVTRSGASSLLILLQTAGRMMQHVVVKRHSQMNKTEDARFACFILDVILAFYE